MLHTIRCGTRSDQDTPYSTPGIYLIIFIGKKSNHFNRHIVQLPDVCITTHPVDLPVYLTFGRKPSDA